ncbi:stage V sporulation protein AC [Marinicrinis sediminis]|uniref:Stage V sporulation protein AC n=1 Tax=Marinicrinis sediminis TaxID=1652465 RepID=A0ABW5R9D4_9BACL
MSQANKQTPNQTPAQKKYQQLAKEKEPKRPVVQNCLRAFLVGGGICLVGQAIQDMFVHIFNYDQEKAGDPTVAVLILIAVILTSLGVYDKIGQWAGAGSAVPVTGFANTMCSSALEYRSEGLVLGVGGNMFKLAGPVIVYGVVAAFFVGLVRMIVKLVGGDA